MFADAEQVCGVAVGQCLLNRDSQIVSADPAFAAIVGRRPEALIGKSELELTHESDRAATTQLLNGLRQSGSPFSITKRYVRDDGTFIRVTNHVFLEGRRNAVEAFRVTSSPRTHPLPKGSVTQNWQIAGRMISGLSACKDLFGDDLVSAAPLEALLLLYMAEEDGRSLTVGELSLAAGLPVYVMARWVTVFIERDIVDVTRGSEALERADLRITKRCYDAFGKLLATRSDTNTRP